VRVWSIGIKGRVWRALLGIDQGCSLGHGMPNGGTLGILEDAREGTTDDGGAGVDAGDARTWRHRRSLRHRRFVQQRVPYAMNHSELGSKARASGAPSNSPKFGRLTHRRPPNWWIGETLGST
jgi:hypothetical protein